MVRGVVDAWSLEPIGSLRLGSREYAIPPLTFGRFQRLLSLDASGVAKAMAEGETVAAWPWVEVCIPGVARADWEQHGTAASVAAVFLAFVKGHDWEWIGEAIRFGEPPIPGEAVPSTMDVASGLLAVAKQSAHRIEDLLAMRVEGFYYVVESIRQENERRAAAMREASGESDVPPFGVGFSPGLPSGLMDAIARAEGATDGD